MLKPRLCLVLTYILCPDPVHILIAPKRVPELARQTLCNGVCCNTSARRLSQRPLITVGLNAQHAHSRCPVDSPLRSSQSVSHSPALHLGWVSVLSFVNACLFTGALVVPP